MRASLDDPRQWLRELFGIAVAAADPLQALPPHLPRDTRRRALVIGAGKAAAAMASALEQHWAGELSGLVVTRYGHALPCKRIEVVEAAHPVPDAHGAAAVQRILALVSALGADDLVICLLSGGGSALLSLPAPGITLADKQAINKALLRCGAAIDEINCVRKHLSAAKGGRLAAACGPAQLITYAISDVPGDHPSVIASGPTVPDSTTSAEALGILRRYDIALPPTVVAWLEAPGSESLKTGDAAFARSEFHLIATPRLSLQAAASAARDAGVGVTVLGDDLEGAAREVALAHADLALRTTRDSGPAIRPRLILSGGETTVAVTGSGSGGRNTEFLLSLAVALDGMADVYALAADTDGFDGAQDCAGAVLAPDSMQRARELGLDAAALLDDNDSHRFFAALDDLVITGPTRTNVNDFRAVLIVPGDGAAPAYAPGHALKRKMEER
jgi:glycerate 2-kinase